MVCRILDAYGVDYGSRNVLADPAIRDGIKAFTGWPTIPQVKEKGGGGESGRRLQSVCACGVTPLPASSFWS